MMTRLRQCSTEVIGRIKKMFTCLIKEAFRYRFEFQCPKFIGLLRGGGPRGGVSLIFPNVP